MNKTILSLAVALAFGGGVVSLTVPAQADDFAAYCVEQTTNDGDATDKTAGACACVAEATAGNDALRAHIKETAASIPSGPDRVAAYTDEARGILFDQCGPWE